MSQAKRFVVFAVLGLMVTAGVGYRAVAQNAEEGGEPNKQQGQRMMQCPMMEAFQSVQLYADTPAVLLAQKESLELNEQQQAKLEAIAAEAREKAQDVLTEEQRQQLGKAPSGPLSPMQLAKVQKGKKAGEAKGQMCPMCMKMMEQMKQGRGGEPNDH